MFIPTTQIVQGSSAVGYGLTLPAGSDGLEYILVDSLTDPSYQWRFRYNAGSGSSYKWEFIGGAPAFAEVLTAQNISSASYGDLATVGPSITLPYGGDWLVNIYSKHSTSNYGYSSYALGGTAASDAWGVVFSGDAPAGPYSLAGFEKHTGLAAVAITMKYRTISGGAGTFAERRLEVLPVRVG